MSTHTPHDRIWYAFWLVVGLGLSLYSAIFDFNIVAYIAGLLTMGGAVSLDREVKRDRA